MSLTYTKYTNFLFLALAISLPISGSMTTIFWMLLFILTVIKFVKDPDYSIFKDKIHYPLYIFIFLTLLAILFSIKPIEAVKELKKTTQCFIMFMFIYQMKDDLELNKKFVKYFFIGLSIVASFGIFQYILGINNHYGTIYYPNSLEFLKNYDFKILKYLYLNDGRVQGFQSMHITYAELVASGFAFIFPFYVNRYLKKFSFIKILMLILMILAIVFSFTRGVWLGIFAYFIYYFIFVDSKFKKYFLMMFLSCILFLGIFYKISNIINDNRRDVISRFKTISFADNQDRVKMWKTGSKIIKDHPILGIGPKCTIFVYDFYLVPGGKINQGHLHNSYIQIAVDRGILTALIFMLMLLVYFIFFIKNYYKFDDEYRKYIALGGAGFLIVYAVFNLTEYAFGDNEVTMMFWSILGCGISAIYYNNQKNLEK